jgi:hypothetical protein
MGARKGIEPTLDFSDPKVAPNPPAAGGTSSDLSSRVLASLKSLGYAHLSEPHNHDEFERIAVGLGSIALRTDLVITPTRNSIVYRPHEITLHQDNPTMNVIGWYCVRQDQFDGSTRLLDAGDVVDYFSRDEIEMMKRTNVAYPDPDSSRHNPDVGLTAHLFWPLLTENPTRTEVYYVPWLLIDAYDEQQSRVLEKFAKYYRRKEADQLITIRLKAGESLFIDNNRILHGRGPIQEDSQRFLKRVWIKRRG